MATIPSAPDRAAPADRRPRVSPWDVAGAGGLLVALVAVFLLDRAAIAPPPEVPPETAAAEVPDLPDLPPPDELASSGSVVAPPPPPPPPPADEAAAPPPPPPEDFQPRPVDPTRRIQVGFGGMRTIGLRTDRAAGGQPRRLTLNEFGETNHTLVEVDGRRVPFFDSSGVVVQNITSEGKGSADNSNKFGESGTTEISILPDTGPYTVRWRYGPVVFEQWVDYEAGAVTRRMDTLRVRYTITNTDRARPHTAGLRLMIDTLIGENDGVPFFVPGRKGVIDRPLELTGKDVPQAVLALERPDLNDSTMTVAQLGFGEQAGERPGRLVLSQWPGNPVVARRYPAEVWRAVDGLAWDWKVGESFGKDSAVGLYYPARSIPPGGSRTFSFTYGLGSLSAGDAGNARLKLYSAGPFVAGKPFLLTAFVRNPGAGQTVRLTLPKELRLADGEKSAEKPVETQPGVEVTKVDWMVVPEASAGGKLEVSAELPGAGLTERLPLFVNNPNPGVREVVVSGAPTPGGRFRLTAQIASPRAGTTATLALPAGFSTVGEPAEKPVAAGAVGQASWVVEVAADRVGRFDVGVRLSGGAGEARTAVEVRHREPAVHKVVVTGRPAAGGAFRVTAQVLSPGTGTSARLDLPAGLALAAGEAAVKPLPAGAVAQPSWVVRADPSATGSRAVEVRLIPGGPPVREAVTIGPPVRALTARVAQNGPVVRGRPFWVVADVSNPDPGEAAEVVLPPGFALAAGHAARKPLEAKGGYGRAAWPVVLEGDREGPVELSVSVAGRGQRAVGVTCQRGNLVQ